MRYYTRLLGMRVVQTREAEHHSESHQDLDYRDLAIQRNTLQARLGCERKELVVLLTYKGEFLGVTAQVAYVPGGLT